VSIVDVSIPEQLARHAGPARTDRRGGQRDATSATGAGRAYQVGSHVAVRNRYLGTWSPGFEVAAVRPDGYRIRRSSDGAVFGDVIEFGDVREPFGPPADWSQRSAPRRS
jgi:hypothetical protein